MNTFFRPSMGRRALLTVMMCETVLAEQRASLPTDIPTIGSLKKAWKVFVAPTVHTDIGYTDHQSKIPAIHNANTDLAITLCQKYPDYRFRLECSWSALMYERYRHSDQFNRLMDLARQRRIGVESNYVNILSGLCSAEELTRLLYPSAELARRFGIPFETCTQNDTPSYVWSFPTVLRRAGVRYLTIGVNNNGTRGPMLRGGLDKRSPFWWEGPDGSKVLTWYTGGYVDVHHTGLAKDIRTAEAKLPKWLAGWEQRADYPYDAVLIHGGYGDNQEIAASLAETVTAWNNKYASPKITMTGFGEFFDYIERKFADKIPTIRGCGGCWWEDGAASSAHETALNRANHHRIAAVEALWSTLSLLASGTVYPKERIARTWENILLYDEHTWGARRWNLNPEHDSIVKQWTTKAAFAVDADRESRLLLEEALSLLGNKVAGRGKGVLVFNPLSWIRTDIVGSSIPRNAAIADDKGRLIPFQIISEDDSAQAVRFVAESVPALGYRRYDIVSSSAAPASTHKPAEAPRFVENRFYKITLDDRSGGISSILDKATGAEWVDSASPYKLGEVIYASGGKGTRALDWKYLKPARFDLDRPQRASWRTTAQGPIQRTVRSGFQLKMFPEAGLEVTLYEDLKRIDLTVLLNKTLTYELEGVYVAFPFAADKPRFRIEVGGAWVRPDQDMLPGACLDWFCTQNSVILETERCALSWSPVDTPLFSLCDINTGKWLEKLEMKNGSVFAYVMNNYWPTNYKPGQGGRMAFRYSITSDKAISTVAGTQHGWGANQPLIAMPVAVPTEGHALPGTRSICMLSSPNVVLTAFKPAEDGAGHIFRIMEVAGRPARFELACDALSAWKQAWRCDSVERTLAPLPLSGCRVQIAVDAFGIETIRLK